MIISEYALLISRNLMKEFKLCFLVLVFSFCCVSFVSAQEDPAQPDAVAEYVPSQPEAPPASFIGFVGTMFKIGISLSIIVLFIYLTVFVLKTVTASADYKDRETNMGSLALIDSLVLRPQQKVFLLKAGKEILVLGSSEKELSLLSKIEDQDTVEEIIKNREQLWKQAKPFGTYLAAAQKKHYLKMYVQEYMDSVKNIFKKRPKA